MSTGEFIGIAVALILALFLSAVAFSQMIEDEIRDVRASAEVADAGCSFFDCARPLMQGRVGGFVVLGPLCPVETAPPDPACALRGYQTTLYVTKTGSPALVALTQSDAEGKFSLTLPEGVYDIRPLGGSPYPLCKSKRVEIKKGEDATLALHCDSGIR